MIAVDDGDGIGRPAPRTSIEKLLQSRMDLTRPLSVQQRFLIALARFSPDRLDPLEHFLGCPDILEPDRRLAGLLLQLFPDRPYKYLPPYYDIEGLGAIYKRDERPDISFLHIVHHDHGMDIVADMRDIESVSTAIAFARILCLGRYFNEPILWHVVLSLNRSLGNIHFAQNRSYWNALHLDPFSARLIQLASRFAAGDLLIQAADRRDLDFVAFSIQHCGKIVEHLECGWLDNLIRGKEAVCSPECTVNKPVSLMLQSLISVLENFDPSQPRTDKTEESGPKDGYRQPD